jgi:hypothetical protein
MIVMTDTPIDTAKAESSDEPANEEANSIAGVFVTETNDGQYHFILYDRYFKNAIWSCI